MMIDALPGTNAKKSRVDAGNSGFLFGQCARAARFRVCCNALYKTEQAWIASRKKQQTRKRKKQDASEVLRRRVQQQFPSKKLIVEEAPDHVKMSEVLHKFIEPYRNVTNTEEAFRKLLTTAAIAWNAALLPAGESKVSLEKVFEALPAEVRADARRILNAMIERKQRYFSEFKRMILDYEVTDTGTDFHLVVISTVDALAEK